MNDRKNLYCLLVTFNVFNNMFSDIKYDGCKIYIFMMGNNGMTYGIALINRKTAFFFFR